MHEEQISALLEAMKALPTPLKWDNMCDVWICYYCGKTLNHEFDKALKNLDKHSLDCPWRKLKEMMEETIIKCDKSCDFPVGSVVRIAIRDAIGTGYSEYEVLSHQIKKGQMRVRHIRSWIEPCN